MKYSRISEMKKEIKEVSEDKLVIIKIIVKNFLYFITRIMVYVGSITFIVGFFLLNNKVILIGLLLVVSYFILRINLFFGKILPYKSDEDINQVLKKHITRDEIYNVFESNKDFIDESITNMIRTDNIIIDVLVTDNYLLENINIKETTNIMILKNKLIAEVRKYFDYNFETLSINTYVSMVIHELIETRIKEIIVRDNIKDMLINKNLLTFKIVPNTNNPFGVMNLSFAKEFIKYAKEYFKKEAN